MISYLDERVQRPTDDDHLTWRTLEGGSGAWDQTADISMDMYVKDHGDVLEFAKVLDVL